MVESLKTSNDFRDNMKSNLIRILILIVVLTVVPNCKRHQPNRPPYPPYAPSGPVWGLLGISYEFNSLAIDPDGDSVAIRFDWGDGDTYNWSNWVETEEIVSMYHYWGYSNNFYIRTQAKDAHGLTTDWSMPLAVKIVANKPPNKPSIPFGPFAGYVDSFYSFSSSAIDEEYDSIAIRFDWGDGDTADWSWLVPSNFPVRRLHSWSKLDTYYLRAQAKDTREQISEWSDERQIIITACFFKLSTRIADNLILQSPICPSLFREK